MILRQHEKDLKGVKYVRKKKLIARRTIFASCSLFEDLKRLVVVFFC